jgi:hypothetical protein
MALIPKIENLTIVTQNVIPALAEEAYLNQAMLLAGGSPAVPVTEYTVSGNTITWNPGVAGYNLEIGEVVTVDYNYDDHSASVGGTGGVYDATDPGQNPTTAEYDLTVILQDIVPDLIHTPVPTTFTLKVNGVLKTEGVDWTRSDREITWISGSTLVVGDTVTVAYRIPA